MEQGGRDERGAIGDQEAHIRQLEAENRKLRRANEILKTPSAPWDACPADLVNRHFVARGLNGLWVADIPYVRAQVGWVCVSFATNVCWRRILGWQVSSLTRTDLSHPRGPEADDHVDDVVGHTPGPQGYRQRLWLRRANIQPDDRRAVREEKGTRPKTLTQPPRARPAKRQSITHLPQNQAQSIAPHPYSPIISMVIHRP